MARVYFLPDASALTEHGHLVYAVRNCNNNAPQDAAVLHPMASVRILTDHAIPQSTRWQGATDRLPRLVNGGFVRAVLYAVGAARQWHRYDLVISANVRNAALLGLIKRLLPGRQPRLMLLEARFDDPRASLAWYAKRAFQRFAFVAVDAICVSARSEVDDYAARLRLPKGRFYFVPWHTNVTSPVREGPSRDSYVLAAGRTGRDWETLAKAATEIPGRIVVVATRRDVEAIPFPSNVAVHCDIPYEQYRQFLREARLVVLPLRVHSYSSGQVALLEAMGLGKPVVCSNVLGTEDYIEDRSNGWLVPPGDPRALATAVSQLLEDPSLADSLAEQALVTVLQRHTLDRYVDSVLDIAARVADRSG